MSSPVGSQRLGKYELREKLGRGGVAEVWKALDTELHRYVAIKLLHADLRTDPEFMTRFTHEARLIAALHHPNIVQIHDFQSTRALEMNAPIAYMVMDYVEGGTLAQYIQDTSRAGRFPAPTDILQLFASISKAIDYAHQEGMIHRDIKPANILLDKRHTGDNSIGEPVLTDFGIAKIVGTSSDTMAGMWLGTPLYISPEQAQGYPGSERSDIYALGVILYEICTGVAPFESESITGILMQQITSPPPSPTLFNPAIPPVLTATILCAMAKDPAERFSSASALTAAIAAAFNLPLPAGLFPPTRPSNPMMQLTHLRPNRSGPSPYITPHGAQWSQPMPVMDSLSQTPPPNPNAQLFTRSPVSGADFPVIPTNSPPAPFSLPSAVPNAQVATPAPVSATKFPPTPPSPPATRLRKARKMPLITWFAVLLVLAGSAFGLIYTFHIIGQANPTSVGTLTFSDSGQYDPATTVGYNDIVTLSLHSLPTPDVGKAYFVWLLPDQGDDETVPLLLGRLLVNGGNATLPYTSPAHTNLLAQYSGVRITEESANDNPNIPSQGTSHWQGSLPNIPTPGVTPPYSLLDHFRHLLAKDPTLQANNIPGGLLIWLTRNVAKVEEWSSAAQGDWRPDMSDGDADQLHNQLIRMLDYLDGTTYVEQDVPAGSPWLADPNSSPSPQAKLGLLNRTQGQNPPGYLQHVNTHLQGIEDVPGHTDEQKRVAIQVDGVISKMITDLTTVRTDAALLTTLTAAQLRQPDTNTLKLLNEMAALTTEVKSGWLDPNTGEMLGGVLWMRERIQQLATISLQTSN